MSTVTRRAEAGRLAALVEGSGTITPGSGRFPVQTYTLGARGDGDSDQTNPEDVRAVLVG